MLSDDDKISIFPQTRWTQLDRAADAGTDDLDRLIRTYWAPLRIYLVATFPSLRNEADQLLQDFAEDKIIKKDWLRRADRSRGRFRDFLKTSLRNFALDRFRRSDARHPAVPLSEVQHELTAPQAASEAFDVLWVRTILAETLKRMEADCKNPAELQPRRGYIWEMFQVRMLEPIFRDADPVPYDRLISRFGLRSPMDASNLLLTAKRLFKAHLTKVIGEYNESDAATAAEVRALEDFVLQLAKGS
jgi:DNA-directed RNA polymerase specialized sigma24 family protein